MEKGNTGRVIRFRAWDGTAMRSVDSAMWNERQGMQCLFDHTNDDFEERMLPETSVIMQFTGLLDRNGKEIYEGDIVRARLMHGDNHTYVHPVEYVTHPAPMFAINGRQMNDDELEVIGNIYENPELLT